MDKTRFYTKKSNIVLLAILCCVLWGSAYPAVKCGYELFNIGADDIATKLIFAGYRFSLAGLIVLIYEIITKNNIFAFNAGQYGKIALLGIINTTIQYIFFYVGLSYTTGVRGSIINGTGTFMSIILAHFLYKNDKIKFNKIIGCIIGFSGVVLVNLNGASSLSGSFSIKGEGFILISTCAFALGSIYSKSITQKMDAAIVTGYQLFIGGLILTILGYTFGGRLTRFTLQSTTLLVYMALLSAVAFVIWMQLFKFNKVGKIAVFNFLVPVFGTLLSGVFLHENIYDIKILIALVLVCSGIYLVYREKAVTLIDQTKKSVQL